MSNIVERLRDWAIAGAASRTEKELDAIMVEAAVEIERLRSIAGKADVGASFAEVTSKLRHPSMDEPFGV